MSFTPGPEAEELRAVVRGFLERRCDESEVRRWMETDEGYDPGVWRQAAEELGLQGLAIDERWGGCGASTVELGVGARAVTEVVKLVEKVLAEYPPATTDDRELRGARFDAGLAFVHFDEGCGGLGLDSSLQPVVERMFLDAGCPNWNARNVIGLGMAAATVHTHGTHEQRAQYLRPLFTGEEIWCQLFSEPGAGSDLAALGTRAVPDGPNYILNGQKIWTSLGHVAKRGLLVARTDPDKPKHRGLSYFLLDMETPGVEVRALRQITGQVEFNEVYLTDVVVPAADMLGAVGEGWRVSMTTLMNERVAIGRRGGRRGDGPIGYAVAYRKAVTAGTADPSDRDKLMKLWARVEAARLSNVRAAGQAGKQAPGPEGSIAKLQFSDLNKAVFEFAVDLLGDDALLIDDYTFSRPDASSGAARRTPNGPRPPLEGRASIMSSCTGIDPRHFRDVLGNYPTGVTVVTAIDESGAPAGMAVGSFTSVSLDPPLVAFLPDRSSTSFPKIRTAASFCVNVLAADQEEVCRGFAVRGGDKFAGVAWTPSASGAPRLDGVAAWIDCDFESITDAGDHYIVLGRVRELLAPGDRLPLVFFRGTYGHFTAFEPDGQLTPP